MNQSVRFHHVAFHCNDKDKALFFYQDILGLDLVKTFSLSRELTNDIFGLNEPVDVIAFQNDGIYIEIFFISSPNIASCHHVGLIVEDLEEFIDFCRNNDVVTYSVKKEQKPLWFIKDFSGNIFEIKQQ